METRYISVAGMTCDHCARAVTAEVSRLPGVTAVDVDVTAGQVRISASRPLEDAALRAAIDEAGYALLG